MSEEERKDDQGEGKGKPRIMEGIEIIVDEAKSAARSAIRQTDALGESLKETLDGALHARENVVMVRLNRESAGRLEELVEAGVVGSRSEAAAFLVGEGIKRRQRMFDRISQKIQDIRKAKEDLRKLLEEEAPVVEVGDDEGEESKD